MKNETDAKLAAGVRAGCGFAAGSWRTGRFQRGRAALCGGIGYSPYRKPKR